MSFLRPIARGLARLFRRTTAEQDLDDELRHFLELSARSHEHAGRSAADAERAARVELGGIEAVKHDLRRVGWESAVETFLQDLRYAARTLARRPGFTLVIVLALALGIGANTATFTVVDAVLLRSLPFREPDRLVRIFHQKPAAGLTEMGVSPGSMDVWLQEAPSLAEVGGFFTTHVTITGNGEPEQIAGAEITANVFSILGQRPLLGRTFRPDEHVRGNDRVVVLGHDLWLRRFGGDSSVVGRSITLEHDRSYAVIGVMPASARFPEQSEFWIPLAARGGEPHGMRFISAIGRLAPGATLAQARTELRTIDERLRASFPGDYEGWSSSVVSLHDSIVGSVSRALYMLLGAVGFVLLIACANVANLLLARGSTRLREMAVRTAVGASRRRLLRQLLTESALLAAIGGGAGLALSWWGVRALVALDPPNVPRLGDVSIDARVLLFTLGTIVAVGVLFGLTPAFRLSRSDVGQALKDGTALTSRGTGRVGPRGALVVAQTALAVVLLTGAALMLVSFRNLRGVDLGFDPERLFVLRVAPATARLGPNPRMHGYFGRLVDSIAAIPGVASAAAASSPPLGGAQLHVSFAVDGSASRDSSDQRATFVAVVAPGYFETIGARLVAGRSIGDGDAQGAPAVAVVNEAFSQRYLTGTNPIGRVVTLPVGQQRTFAIVGVVANINQFGVETAVEPNVYLSDRQQRAGAMAVVARATGDPSSILPAARARALRADPFAPVTRLETMDDAVARAIALPRFYTTLLGIFAVVAMSLAAIGLYGVMSYSVSRRAYEIGMRLSLGATPARIRRMVVLEGLTLSSVGLVIGLGAALALTRVLETLLFGVTASDPATFLAIALVLGVIALVACWVPARRATKIDPMTTLRSV